jgi:hypothetical protein
MATYNDSTVNSGLTVTKPINSVAPITGKTVETIPSTQVAQSIDACSPSVASGLASFNSPGTTQTTDLSNNINAGTGPSGTAVNAQNTDPAPIDNG